MKSARLRVEEVAQSLLWDAPPESRNINERTRAVLARRARQLPVPERLMLIEERSARLVGEPEPKCLTSVAAEGDE